MEVLIVERAVIAKTGQPLSAVDYAGKELPLYIEDPPPEDERPVGWLPTLICPDCGKGKLRRGSTGNASGQLYYCTNNRCGVKWRSADNMLSGIALEMA